MDSNTAAELHFRIELRANLRESWGEPDDVVTRYTGKIIVIEDHSEVEAGHVLASVVHPDEGEHPLYAVLDSDTQTVPFLPLVDEEGRKFSKLVNNLLGTDRCFSSSVLLLHRFELLPRYRRRALGLRALELLIERLGLGCQIAAMKLVPLQFEVPPLDPADPWRQALRLEDFKISCGAATRKLKAFYETAHFVSVQKTDLMIRDLISSETDAQKGVR
jgi:hypothetical protein